MTTEAQKRANKKYTENNVAYQTIRLNKKLLEKFKATVKARGDRVNTVLRQAIIDYIGDENSTTSPTEGDNENNI